MSLSRVNSIQDTSLLALPFPLVACYSYVVIMCAINGFNFRDEALIEKMNKLNRHRGPDGTGAFFDKNLSLGHNLLAITDTPKNLHQPFLSSDKNLVLLYNGEIYNYQKSSW